MTITDKTVKKLEELGFIVAFYDNNINDVSPDIATTLSISTFDPYYKNYSFKPPKKEITLDWIVNKINLKDNQESINWNKFFEPLNLNNVGFYTTSYGLGVEVIFGHKNDTIQKIKDYLNSKQIAFTNEYSDANWVFRFKISKSKENIDKIQLLNNF